MYIHERFVVAVYGTGSSRGADVRLQWQTLHPQEILQRRHARPQCDIRGVCPRDESSSARLAQLESQQQATTNT